MTLARRLMSLIEAAYGLPFVLADKWASEAQLAVQQTVALELANEELRRRRAAAKKGNKP